MRPAVTRAHRSDAKSIFMTRNTIAYSYISPPFGDADRKKGCGFLPSLSRNFRRFKPCMKRIKQQCKAHSEHYLWPLFAFRSAELLLTGDRT
jgi:hypothetical protein